MSRVEYDEESFEIHKVFVVKEDGSDGRRDIYTVSPFPDRVGWETDSGYDGYGLPKRLAEVYAKAINEYIQQNGAIEHIPINKFK